MQKNVRTLYKRHLAHALATTLEAKCDADVDGKTGFIHEELVNWDPINTF